VQGTDPFEIARGELREETGLDAATIFGDALRELSERAAYLYRKRPLLVLDPADAPKFSYRAAPFATKLPHRLTRN
jgi:8-oxo-dGTP pyrophosphatase MutT (NUDIX family)